MRKVYWLLFCFLCFLQSLPAQDSRLYAFTHYTVKDGLASYNTQSVVQDEQGYMWIGTINGLQRFDGTRFITFRHHPGDTGSLPDNYIYQLHIDRQQQLWVLLNNGKVGVFDTRRFLFKEVKIRLSDQRNLSAIRGLIEDSEGNLFYAIDHKEVLTLNRKENEFAAVHNPFDLPVNWNWKVSNVVEDSIGKKYWIATDSGMAVYNKVTRQLSYRGHNADKEPFIEQFGHLSGLSNYGVDAQRRLWFLGWPYTREWGLIYCYDLHIQKPVFKDYNLVPLVKNYFEPSCILQQKDGTIWLAGLNIFVKYDALQKKFQQVYNGYVNDQGISYERVKCLFEDREQNIWVATDNNGLYVFNPSMQFFNSIKHINRNSRQDGRGALLSFAVTNTGKLLTGTWGDGLYQYDSSLNPVPFHIRGMDSLRKYSIWDMCTLSDKKTIWMVGQPSVIMLYDQVAQSIKKYHPKIFNGRTIRQVAEDRLGNIWLGMQSSGVFKWTPGAGTKNFEEGFYKVSHIPDIKIQGITADSKGFIWICTATEGIYKINPANDSIVDHITTAGPPSKRLLNNDAISALEYNDSIMIFLTGALNIYNTRTHTISYITAWDGLPSESATSIQKDRNGYLWIGLLSGLCRMNLEKKTFTRYDRLDGIANDNFDIASHYLPNGRMLFG
ncbi:two-component regulator propeller domain-containing protein, partial [Agriterribacter sp.]|uniref:ligand-binding sensor domain-containing protein n=1 Tax=Agriterribacter sp. TaxID=2821509 RepID=UPI002B5A43F2